jgi:hypothetical protein
MSLKNFLDNLTGRNYTVTEGGAAALADLARATETAIEGALSARENARERDVLGLLEDFVKMRGEFEDLKAKYSEKNTAAKKPATKKPAKKAK